MRSRLMKILRTIKHAGRLPFLGRAEGRAHRITPDLSVEHVTLGTEYGESCVSLRGLGSASVAYSFGVGEDVSFDLGLIQRTGLVVHAFDPTPRSIAWVARQKLPPQFVMHGVGLAAYDGVARFRPPENPTHVSHTLLERERTDHAAIEVPVKRVETLMRELGHRRVDVLKMDIEGAEYDVIEDIIASSVVVDQMLIEFHHQLPGVPVSRTLQAVERVRGGGYGIFHVSDSGRHFSFMHRRMLETP